MNLITGDIINDKHFENIHELLMNLEILFSYAPEIKGQYQKYLVDRDIYKCTPYIKYAKSRWCQWIKSVKYVFEYFTEIKDFVLNFYIICIDQGTSQSINNIQRLFFDKKIITDLNLCFINKIADKFIILNDVLQSHSHQFHFCWHYFNDLLDYLRNFKLNQDIYSLGTNLAKAII